MRMAQIGLANIVFVILIGMHSAVAQTMGSPGMPPSKMEPSDPLLSAASRWDANHDGVFTCDEWKQYAARIFAFSDKNSDGFLDTKEFQQLGKLEPIFSGAEIDYFDTDHDQRVSRKEFVDKPNPFFLRYDANSDCRVTSEEMKGSGAAGRDKSKGGMSKGGAPSGTGMGRF